MIRKLLLSCMSLVLTVTFLLPQGLVNTVRAEEKPAEGRTAVYFNTEDRKTGSEPGQKNALGFIDEEIDKTHLLHGSTEQKSGNNDYLAASYNLVSKGLVTPVKDQNPYGTCWTFATMASAESGILKKYGKTLDLAELQLAYFNYNSYKKADLLSLITNDGVKLSTNNYILDMGGNSFRATLSTANGIGFSKEASYPYTNAATYISSGTSKACYNSAYMLRAARWLFMDEPNLVKQALIDYGAAAVSYYHSDSYVTYTSSGDCVYYQNSQTGSNHAVTLVGWNDNYSRTNFPSSKRPSSNGAWLIKNSWGTGWGKDGYFWISYEDTSIMNSMVTFFDVDMDYSSSNTKLYQYDGSNYGGYWYWGSNKTVYQANVYTTQGDNEVLTDVGFIADAANTSYTIYIYNNVTGDPSTGTLATSQSGTLTDAGYYLISLKNPVSLTKGKKYSVVIKVTVPTDKVYLYFDATNSSSSDGITIYNYNDTTNDLSYASLDGSSWDNLSVEEGWTNRIKAVTREGTVEAPEITKVTMDTDGVHLKWSAVSNADKYMVYRKAAGESDYTKLKTVTTTTYTDATALAGEKYTYAVKAYNSSLKKYSAYSNKMTFVFNPFSDVDENSSFFKKICWAYNNKIVSGTSKTTFNPKGTAQRRSFAIMFWKTVGKPEPQGTASFNDIGDCSANEKKAIQWCYENGIVNGTGNGTFTPYGEVTRKQVIIMIWKAVGKPEATASNPFTDINGLSKNEKKAIIWAYENGITSGTTATTFSPDQPCKREQLCTFLYKLDSLMHAGSAVESPN